jgi:hypothetical protein
MDQPSPIPWHPAFVQAIKLELEPYLNVLEFITEYQLTAEPLEIDVVIIKKLAGLTIDKNIATIFRKDNIFEYKSPDDYFSVYDFYKALSYAFLYASLNHINIEDMTLSIVETRHPRELLSYFESKENCGVTEYSPGVYHVRGYPLAIQVIESKKLPLEENLWLRGLAKDLNVAAAGIILEESRRKGKGVELAAYLHALIQANLMTIREVLEMSDEELTFDKLMEETGLAAKWEDRGTKNGWKRAIELLKQGYTVEQLERMAPPVLEADGV